MTATSKDGLTATSTVSYDVVALVDSTLPKIVSDAIDGGTLSGTDGSWFGPSQLSYSWQWELCPSTDATGCTNLPGATSLTVAAQLQGRRPVPHARGHRARR